MHHPVLSLHLGDEESPTSSLIRRLRASRIVAVSCAFSVAIYGLFVCAVLGTGSALSTAPAASDLLRFVLYNLALVGQLACFGAVSLLPRPRLPVASLGASLQTRTVIRMAFSEIPAVFGLLLFLLRHSAVDFAALGTLSLVMIALRWPSTREWERVASDAGLKVRLDC